MGEQGRSKLGGLPRGIEVLIAKAAVDPAFKTTLLVRRAGAADEIGLTLTPAEVAMLTAVPAGQLAAIIARTRVDDRIRPAFLGKVAGVMLVALSAATLVDQGCAPNRTKGIAPDRPSPEGHASSWLAGRDEARPSNGRDEARPSNDPTGAAQLADFVGGEEASPLPGPRLAGGGGLFTAGNSPDRPPAGASAGISPDRPGVPTDKLIGLIRTMVGNTAVEVTTPVAPVPPATPVVPRPTTQSDRPVVRPPTTQPTPNPPTTGPA